MAKRRTPSKKPNRTSKRAAKKASKPTSKSADKAAPEPADKTAEADENLKRQLAEALQERDRFPASSGSSALQYAQMRAAGSRSACVGDGPIVCHPAGLRACHDGAALRSLSFNGKPHRKSRSVAT